MDDTSSIPELLIHTLRSLVSDEIIAVTGATAALTVLTARSVPLLITDYHLSDMRRDALALATRCASPTTKVMIITADVELDAEAGRASANQCLIKPFPCATSLQLSAPCCQAADW